MAEFAWLFICRQNKLLEILPPASPIKSIVPTFKQTLLLEKSSNFRQIFAAAYKWYYVAIKRQFARLLTKLLDSSYFKLLEQHGCPGFGWLLAVVIPMHEACALHCRGDRLCSVMAPVFLVKGYKRFFRSAKFLLRINFVDFFQHSSLFWNH